MIKILKISAQILHKYAFLNATELCVYQQIHLFWFQLRYRSFRREVLEMNRVEDGNF